MSLLDDFKPSKTYQAISGYEDQGLNTHIRKEYTLEELEKLGRIFFVYQTKYFTKSGNPKMRVYPGFKCKETYKIFYKDLTKEFASLAKVEEGVLNRTDFKENKCTFPLDVSSFQKKGLYKVKFYQNGSYKSVEEIKVV